MLLVLHQQKMGVANGQHLDTLQQTFLVVACAEPFVFTFVKTLSIASCLLQTLSWLTSGLLVEWSFIGVTLSTSLKS